MVLLILVSAVMSSGPVITMQELQTTKACCEASNRAILAVKEVVVSQGHPVDVKSLKSGLKAFGTGGRIFATAECVDLGEK